MLDDVIKKYEMCEEHFRLSSFTYFHPLCFKKSHDRLKDFNVQEAGIEKKIFFFYCEMKNFDKNERTNVPPRKAET